MNLNDYLPAVFQLYNSKQVNLIISTKLYLIWLKTVLSHLDKDEDFELQHVIKDIENVQKHHLSCSDFLTRGQYLTDLNDIKKSEVLRPKMRKGIRTRKRTKKVGFNIPENETRTDKRVILSPKNCLSRNPQVRLYTSDVSESLCDEFQLGKSPLNKCCDVNKEFSNLNIVSEGIVNSRTRMLGWVTDSSNNDNSTCSLSPSNFLAINRLKCSFRNGNSSICPDPMWASSPLSYNSNICSSPKQPTHFSETSSLSMIDKFKSQPDMSKINEQNSLKNIDTFSPNICSNNEINIPNIGSSSSFIANSTSPYIAPNLYIDVSDGISWDLLSSSSPNSNVSFRH